MHVRYFNSTVIMSLYPQNGGRIVTIDSVTSLHLVYSSNYNIMNSEPFIKIEALSMKYSHVSVADCTIFSGRTTCAEHRTVSCDC